MDDWRNVLFDKDDNGNTYLTLSDGSRGERVFVIPEPNLSSFQERVAKLQKRAAKIGCEIPSYTQVFEEFREVKGRNPATDEVEKHLTRFLYFTLHHPKVVVSGFEFISKLEHTEEGNVLHTLEGKIVPLKYRDCPADCDHCGFKRKRNETFVLQEVATGEYRQVGRNCLADYLGRDAEMYAHAAELYSLFAELASASEDDDSFGGGGGGKKYEYLDAFLGFVAEVIHLQGWKSRTAARYSDTPSTCDVSLFHMYPPFGAKAEDFLFRHPTEESKQTAKEAIAWCENLPDDQVISSDYLHNIRVIARRGIIGDRQYGMAASIVAAYLREQLRLKLQERQNTQPSHWVGQVGDRSIFELLVEQTKTMEDNGWGPSVLHLMSDKDGNAFVWFSSVEPLDTGKEYLLKGTIKAHTERNGVQQTQLTRVYEVRLLPFTCLLKDGTSHTVEAEDDKDAKKRLVKLLGLKRLPHGTMVLPQQTTTT